MICGILALPSCYTTLVPAIIMGHIAWSKAGREGGNRSRAKLGLIFGYGSLAMIPVIAMIAGLTAPLVLRQRHKADLAECVSNVRQIGLALMEYENEYGAVPPDLKQLETSGVTTNIDQLLSMKARNDGEWLYFPKADPKNPKSALLISPPIDKKSVVLRVDLSVRSEDRAVLPEVDESGNPPIRIPVPLRVAR